MLRLTRVDDALPAGFEVLRAEAEAEGHRHMTRLEDEFRLGSQAFIAVFAAWTGGALAGIGALTPEPTPAAEPTLRMRRLYVRPPFRRQGVARALASALLQEAMGSGARVTVHAGGPEASMFWEAQGFTPVEGAPWSHVYAVTAAARP